MKTNKILCVTVLLFGIVKGWSQNYSYHIEIESTPMRKIICYDSEEPIEFSKKREGGIILEEVDDKMQIEIVGIGKKRNVIEKRVLRKHDSNLYKEIKLDNDKLLEQLLGGDPIDEVIKILVGFRKNEFTAEVDLLDALEGRMVRNTELENDLLSIINARLTGNRLASLNYKGSIELDELGIPKKILLKFEKIIHDSAFSELIIDNWKIIRVEVDN